MDSKLKIVQILSLILSSFPLSGFSEGAVSLTLSHIMVSQCNESSFVIGGVQVRPFHLDKLSSDSFIKKIYKKVFSTLTKYL